SACGRRLLLYLRAKAYRPRWGSACGSAAEQAPLYRIPPPPGAANHQGRREPSDAVEPSVLGCGNSRTTVFRSVGWGCPLVVSKGGGGGRRLTPEDMETKGHPRPTPGDKASQARALAFFTAPAPAPRHVSQS